MKNNRENKVFHIDPTYIRYRRLWKEDRWKFSGDLVKLNIAKSTGDLTEQQQHELDTMNRVVEENDNDWSDEHNLKNNLNKKKRLF